MPDQTTSAAIGSAPPAAADHAPAYWRGLGSEILAGLTVACVALPICVGAGVIAFSPLGPDRVAFGAVAGVITAVAVASLSALLRRSSFVVTIPSTPVAVVQASLAATVLDALGGDVEIAMAIVPFCIVTVGLLQILFAATNLGRLVKFAPYPVVAGFVTGIGLLIVVAQLTKLFATASLAEIATRLAAFNLAKPWMPVFGLGLAAAMFVLARTLPRVPNLIAGLVLGFAVYYAMRAAFPGLDLGPTLGPVSIKTFFSERSFSFAVVPEIFSNFAVLQALILSAFTIAMLGTLDIFFALRAVQNLADMPVAPRRDLFAQGASNVVAGAFSGLATSASLALTSANFRAGGRGRVSSITAAAVLLAAVVFLPQAIVALPVAVLAAVLLVVGLRLADRWVVEVLREAWRADEPARRARARRNALIVLVVMLATVFGQPVVGAAVGVLLACLLFIMDMSQPVVRRQLIGDRLRSKRVRSRHDLDLLAKRGSRIAVLELQGVLFFGNADDLAQQLRGLDETADIVILDMHRITSVDTSGATVLQQIATRCRAKGKSLLICAANPRFRRIVESAAGQHGAGMFADLDSALEWAEERVIARGGEAGAALELPLERTDLARDLSAADLDVLRRHLKPAHYAAGEALCRAGDAADRLWIISRGSVSVRLSGGGTNRRLASLAPGCSVGEMGLLERQPRSADVIADSAVEAFLLTAASFEAILREHPQVGQAMLGNIAKQLAQRLRYTSEDLRLAEG